MLAIFDFDGVIADSVKFAVRNAKAMLDENGHEAEISEEEVRSLGFKAFVEKYRIPRRKIPFYIREGQKRINAEINEIRPFPGIKEALENLKEKHKLAIVTSNSEENVKAFLDNNGMEGLFDTITAGASIFGKAGKMKQAVKKAGAGREEAVCIGDEARDIEAARKAGIRIIAVTWGFNTKELLEKSKPDFIAKSVEEMMDALNSGH